MSGYNFYPRAARAAPTTTVGSFFVDIRRLVDVSWHISHSSEVVSGLSVKSETYAEQNDVPRPAAVTATFCETRLGQRIPDEIDYEKLLRSRIPGKQSGSSFHLQRRSATVLEKTSLLFLGRHFQAVRKRHGSLVDQVDPDTLAHGRNTNLLVINVSTRTLELHGDYVGSVPVRYAERCSNLHQLVT